MRVCGVEGEVIVFKKRYPELVAVSCWTNEHHPGCEKLEGKLNGCGCNSLVAKMSRRESWLAAHENPNELENKGLGCLMHYT